MSYLCAVALTRTSDWAVVCVNRDPPARVAGADLRGPWWEPGSQPKGNVVGIDPVARSVTSSIPVNQSVMRNLTEES